jgi:hypothetical protein
MSSGEGVFPVPPAFSQVLILALQEASLSVEPRLPCCLY